VLKAGRPERPAVQQVAEQSMLDQLLQALPAGGRR
jgi:hypothetical protein